MNQNVMGRAARPLGLLATVGVALAVGTALALWLPAELWAAAGDTPAAGGASVKGAENFNKKGLSSVQKVGAVIFAVVAIISIARGSAGGKLGQGLLGFGVACLGMAVSIEPEATMSAIGGWATDLFKG